MAARKSGNPNKHNKTEQYPVSRERWPADFKACGMPRPANPRFGCDIERIGTGRAKAKEKDDGNQRTS